MNVQWEQISVPLQMGRVHTRVGGCDLIKQATLRSKFIGADPASFPRDFAVYARYHDDLLRTIPERQALPPPLTLGQFDEFLQTHAQRYHVGWTRDMQPLAA
jgi:hypothetical protein